MTKVQYVDNFNLALTQATLAEKLRQAQKDVHDFNKFLEDRYLEKAKEKLNEEGKDLVLQISLTATKKLRLSCVKRLSGIKKTLQSF